MSGVRRESSGCMINLSLVLLRPVLPDRTPCPSREKNFQQLRGLYQITFILVRDFFCQQVSAKKIGNKGCHLPTLLLSHHLTLHLFLLDNQKFLSLSLSLCLLSSFIFLFPFPFCTEGEEDFASNISTHHHFPRICAFSLQFAARACLQRAKLIWGGNQKLRTTS